MNKDLDSLLMAEWLSVPDDFAERVMQEIERRPQAAPQRRWARRLQWLAVGGTAALGVSEIFSFIFGIWAATTAY